MRWNDTSCSQVEQYLGFPFHLATRPTVHDTVYMMQRTPSNLSNFRGETKTDKIEIERERERERKWVRIIRHPESFAKGKTITPL